PEILKIIDEGGNLPHERNVLSRREMEVLREIVKGHSNKEISEALFVSEKTVKTHVSHILNKLEVSDRTQAFIYAIKFNNVYFQKKFLLCKRLTMRFLEILKRSLINFYRQINEVQSIIEYIFKEYSLNKEDTYENW